MCRNRRVFAGSFRALATNPQVGCEAGPESAAPHWSNAPTSTRHRGAGLAAACGPAIRCIYSYQLRPRGEARDANLIASRNDPTRPCRLRLHPPVPARACDARPARSRNSTMTRSRPSGLRATQFGLLRTLARHETMTISSLAARLLLDRTALSRNLDPLAERGLVEVVPGSDLRTRQHNDDRGGQACARGRRAALGGRAARSIAPRRQATARRALRVARRHRAPAPRAARHEGIRMSAAAVIPAKAGIQCLFVGNDAGSPPTRGRRCGDGSD